MKTFLITGGAGFIASSLIEEILQNNTEDKIITIDNFNDFYSPILKEKNVKDFFKNKNFSLIRGDIRDKALLSNIFQENKIDIVVHIAAMAGVRPSFERPDLYIDVNIQGTQNILDLMKEYEVKKIIIASSSSVYANNKNLPFKETDDVSYAISPYAMTKKTNELQAHVFHQAYKIDAILLRFFTVYGPKQRPDLAIRKFIDFIKEGKEIPFYGDGNSKRDYTYISDIIFGIRQSIDYLLDNKDVYQIINLGSSNPILLKDMLSQIETALGKKAIVKKLPMQKGDVDATFACVKKAEQILNYYPKVKFREGIEKVINYYK